MQLALYGIFWLLGWYAFLVIGIILIMLGFFISIDFLVILGVFCVIDGILGLLLRKTLGKKDGDKIAGWGVILSSGLMFILFYFYVFFQNIIMIYIGLTLILLGGIGLFFTIRKHLKLKKHKHIEEIIFDYLKENEDKAFTSESIYNRCAEIKDFDLTQEKLKKILDNLVKKGEINSHKKEKQIFYHVRFFKI
ncbi:MAG: hypothetical protein ACFE8E_00065 [Candidatus Hodarchaeota archaeon]